MKTIYTIGHSNLSIDEFLTKLKDNNIDVIVDVRTTPFSKYNPQFNRFDLEKELLKNNIGYWYKGKNLGGLGVNIDFNETIEKIASIAGESKICLMCSEKDANKCHRKQMLESPFLLKDTRLEHI